MFLKHNCFLFLIKNVNGLSKFRLRKPWKTYSVGIKSMKLFSMASSKLLIKPLWMQSCLWLSIPFKFPFPLCPPLTLFKEPQSHCFQLGLLKTKTRITHRHGIKNHLLPSCVSKISTWKISWWPNKTTGTVLVGTYSRDTLPIDSVAHASAVPLGPCLPGASSIGAWRSVIIQFLSKYLTYFSSYSSGNPKNIQSFKSFKFFIPGEFCFPGKAFHFLKNTQESWKCSTKSPSYYQ